MFKSTNADGYASAAEPNSRWHQRRKILTIMIMATINPDNFCLVQQTRDTNAGLMLGQRRRRWTNIKPSFGQCPVFAG